MMTAAIDRSSEAYKRRPKLNLIDKTAFKQRPNPQGLLGAACTQTFGILSVFDCKLYTPFPDKISGLLDCFSITFAQFNC